MAKTGLDRRGRPSSADRAAARLLEFRSDPIGFCEVLLGVRPDAWQCLALRALASGSNVSIRSGHGVGKSALLSWCMLWALSCWPHAKVPCTAPTEHQLWDVLWAEAGRWLKRSELAPYMLFTQTKIAIRGYEESWFAVARTARTAENLAGFHAPRLLYVVDEASGIRDEIMVTVDGALTTEGSQCIMAGNPTRGEGYFFDSHTRSRGRWECFAVSSMDSPRVSQSYAVEMAEKWGLDSDVYRVRVLGEFPKELSESFLRLSEIELAVQRWHELPAGEPVELGVDVARFGSDETVFVLRCGDKVTLIERQSGWDLMQTAGRVIQLCDERGVRTVRVDDTGLGGGVVDRLREQLSGVQVVPVNFGGSGDGHYLNQAGVLWGALRERLRSGEIGLPDNAELVAQLSARRHSITSTGKIALERKSDMKRRKLPSPDIADALVLAFGGVGLVPAGVFVRPVQYSVL